LTFFVPPLEARHNNLAMRNAGFWNK
jgi:hypothetical protein